MLNEPSDSAHSIVELLSPQIPGFSCAQSASVLSNPSSDDQGNDLIFKELAEGDKVVREVGGLEDDSEEEYESELEEAIQGPKNIVCDWSDLQKKIKAHLVKHKNDLPLLQVNQYLILSNFVTFCLKGLKQTQASLRLLTSGMKAQETGLHIECGHLPSITRHLSSQLRSVVGRQMHSHFYIMRLSKSGQGIG